MTGYSLFFFCFFFIFYQSIWGKGRILCKFVSCLASLCMAGALLAIDSQPKGQRGSAQVRSPLFFYPLRNAPCMVRRLCCFCFLQITIVHGISVQCVSGSLSKWSSEQFPSILTCKCILPYACSDQC